ncbi:GHKL domain-containing protein [Arenibacter sp. N53]|uniref:sensor histidine kinase n=1 Tax=Arenibacter TaxID=178469 RepID=UPI000CD3FBEC|nr:MULTISPECIES: histidine kinase [Arenibacter]MCM4150454.1 GHKL domain-containing protein [Arenibacter sp. N53]
MKLDFTSLKKYQKVIVHILVWTALFFLPYILALQVEEGGPRSELTRRILHLNSIMNIFWATTFYLNTLVLVPRLLFQKKIFLFFLGNITFFAGILLLNRWLYGVLITEQPYSFFKGIVFNGLPFLFFVLIGTVFKSVSDRVRMERIAQERESENLKTELSFLRSQISPHFLFNVLNNIVALVRLKSEELEPTIIKLSSLMQYMLYDTDEDKVLLRSEVDYLQSYIDLQKLRFGDRLALVVDLKPKEDWHAIEPMLLIPFVENAFKHGTGLTKDPEINISLQTFNNRLIFRVKNKYLEKDKVKDKVSGIGLTNVQRRLQLLYGKNHSLAIDKTDDWFSVTLELTFEP